MVENLIYRNARYQKLQRLMEDQALNGMYLTGFVLTYLQATGCPAIFIPRGKDPIVMFGDNDRELPMLEWKKMAARGRKWVESVVLHTKEELCHLAAECGADRGRLGIFLRDTSVPRYQELQNMFPHAELVDISNSCIDLTNDNDSLNVQYARDSARIVRECFDMCLQVCKPGMSATHVQTLMDCHMLANGASGTFNLVKPVYRRPENQGEDPDLFMKGDGWYFEVSAASGGVWSQCIYAVSFGGENPLLEKLFEANAAAYYRSLELIHAGISSDELHAPINELIESYGFIGPGKHICLPIGHYQGMQMDGGTFSPGANYPIRENMIIVMHTSAQDSATGVSLFGPGAAMVVTKTGNEPLYQIQDRVAIINN